VEQHQDQRYLGEGPDGRPLGLGINQRPTNDAARDEEDDRASQVSPAQTRRLADEHNDEEREDADRCGHAALPLWSDRYCLAMAIRSRSSGSMKWSWSSLPTSSCTQRTLPLNRLVPAVYSVVTVVPDS
jgi:hypothetical protein